MTKIQTAAQIILSANLAKLAEVHGCPVDQVIDGIKAGNVKLVEQFANLAETAAEQAAEQAAEMHAAGEISLVG